MIHESSKKLSKQWVLYLAALLICAAQFDARSIRAQAVANANAGADRPRLVAQLGPVKWGITAAVFSSDGRFLVTGGGDDSACLWEVATGLMIRRFAGHTQRVNAVAISHDDEWIATGSADATVRLWEAKTGKEIWRKALPSSQNLEFSPDDLYVLVGHDTPRQGNRGPAFRALILEKKTGNELRLIGGDYARAESSSLARCTGYASFAPVGRSVILSVGGTTFVYDAAAGAESRRYEGFCTRAAYAKDGHLFLVGLRDEKLQSLNAVTGEEAWSHAWKLSATSHGSCLAVSADGRWVAFGDYTFDVSLSAKKSYIRLLDTLSGKEVNFSEYSFVLAFAPSGEYLFTEAPNLDSSGVLLRVPGAEEIRKFERRADRADQAAILPDGHSFLRQSGGTVQRWNMLTASEIWSYRSRWSFNVSSNGRYVVVDDLGPASILQTETGEFVWSLKGRPDHYRFSGGDETRYLAVLSADGSLAANMLDAGMVGVWNTSSRQLVNRFEFQSVTLVALSPDNRSILIADSDGIDLFSIHSRAKMWSVKGRPHQFWVRVAAFSPNGRRVLLISDVGQEARIFGVASGDLELRLPIHSRVETAAFSPDGNSVLLGCKNHAAYLYDLSKGELVKEFSGHISAVTSVSFSQNGSRILTGSDDGTIRLWKATGEELCSIAFFKDGTWMVADPQGRFDTNNVEGLVANWSMPDEPMKPLPLEIFMRDYYEPGLLERILHGEGLRPVRSLAKLNRVQPKVEIESVTTQADKPDVVTVRVEVAKATSTSQRDHKGHLLETGVYDLRLFRDGQLVGQMPKTDAGDEL